MCASVFANEFKMCATNEDIQVYSYTPVYAKEHGYLLSVYLHYASIYVDFYMNNLMKLL